MIAVAGGKVSVLGVEKSRISVMVGQKRCNILALEEKFGIRGLKVVAADVKKGEVKIVE